MKAPLALLSRGVFMLFKDLILDCLFPKKCYGCGANNIWLCQKCFLKLQAYQGEIPRALDNSRDLIIAGEYQDSLLQELVIAFKFGLNKELAIPLFSFLKTTIDKKIILDNLSGRFWNDILIVPIPLDKKRRKWRGFNQSELLAREISNYYGWPLSLDLVKVKKTLIQADLDERSRLDNQVGAFKWIGSNLSGKTILLVDDIITSGATMNEAEKILLAVGVSRVIKVALAKG